MNSGLLASEHMFAFQKLCLCYLRTALSTEELKSAILSCVIPCKQDASFDNRRAKGGRLMTRLLCRDTNIGFPLVLIVLEAFYKYSVAKDSAPTLPPSSASLFF